MNYIALRKISYGVSGTLVFLSVTALFWWGLPLGVDFTGGSLLELEFAEALPAPNIVREYLTDFDLGDIQIQQTGERGMLMRTRDLDEEIHQRILVALQQRGAVFTEKRFVSVGPTIGGELKRKALWALGLVLVMIVLYIATVFRKVSHPVSSWKYGIVAIVALIHDVTIPTGLFAYLGRFQHAEVNALFVSALLTVLGFSVHDTIVVFDRIRENLRRRGDGNFEEIVNVSIRETMTRSINTSLTLILMLITLFFFGGESTKFFSLALLVGTVAGTYSSIFIASPLLVTWQKWQERKTK